MFGNHRLAKKDRYEELRAREAGYFDLEFLKAVAPEKVVRCLKLLDQSKAQLRQDIFALQHLDFKEDGFFVEFGATDGVSLNNSYMLEKEFGWTGLLAEPDSRWQNDLSANRSSTLDFRCIAPRSGEMVEFIEAPRGEHSAIADFVSTRRKIRGTSHQVETVSLADFLSEHGAPNVIDYVSIDTEGSEFSILEPFDFNKWAFRVCSIEHNWAPQRDQIHALLTSHGYTRVHELVSRFDDWYVHPDA